MCRLEKLNHPSPPAGAAGADGADGAAGAVGTSGSPSRFSLSHPLQALRDLDLLLSDRGDPRASGWAVLESSSISCTCIISHCKWVTTGESLCSGWSGN